MLCFMTSLDAYSESKKNGKFFHLYFVLLQYFNDICARQGIRYDI